MFCRFCGTPLTHPFIDLVNSPASNSFLTLDQLNEPETFYPLKVFVCDKCFLVQIDEYKKSGSIFNGDYVYFSSISTSWLKHSQFYVEMIINRLGLDVHSQVIELASNDGYLLQYFRDRGIPVLGIEPTVNTAAVAIAKGINTLTEFFGSSLASKLVGEGTRADLLLGNNVLAHVPDIVDFVKGMKCILKDTGVITMEFPHLMQLVENNQFDTIYHEHFSYLSFYSVKKIFESQGLEMFDVEELPTHGGSLRIYAKHPENTDQQVMPGVQNLIQKEIDKGITSLEYYLGFEQKARQVKMDLLEFLLNKKRENATVVAYGAAAKGNTLLNYCGVKNDLIAYTVDANPAKLNKYLPASHIPVISESSLKETKPQYVVILPWNIKEEIMEQLAYIKEWGGHFVIPIPKVEII